MSWYNKIFKSEGSEQSQEKERLEQAIVEEVKRQTAEDARAVQRLLQQQDLLEEAQKRLKDSE